MVKMIINLVTLEEDLKDMHQYHRFSSTYRQLSGETEETCRPIVINASNVRSKKSG
jgi:hypothetical protein